MDSIRKWLGHSVNSDITMRHYAQISPRMVNECVDALNRASRDPGSAGKPGPQYVGPRLLQAVASIERQD